MTLSSLPIHWLWLVAFTLTIVFEAPAYVLLGKKYAGVPKALFGGILGTCITHPLLWFVWRPLFESYLIYVVSGELLVVLIEGVVFFSVVKPISLQKAMAVSLIANAVSYGLGLLVL